MPPVMCVRGAFLVQVFRKKQYRLNTKKMVKKGSQRLSNGTDCFDFHNGLLLLFSQYHLSAVSFYRQLPKNIRYINWAVCLAIFVNSSVY